MKLPEWSHNAVRALLFGLALCAGVFPVQNQLGAASGKIVEAHVDRKISAARGETARIAVAVRLPHGYHVNSHQPRDKYLKPLSLTWNSEVLVPKPAAFPEPIERNYSFSEKTLSVYEGSFEIGQQFTVAKDAATGEGSATGKLAYQACTDSECYPPASVTITVQYNIR